MSEPQTVIEKGWNWDVEIGSISPLEWWILKFDEAGINTKKSREISPKNHFRIEHFRGQSITIHHSYYWRTHP